MAYDPTVWKSGDTITSAKLNKLENGLAEASGGGTGGGVLKVNMTWSEDYSSCTLDKTYAEIYSAFQNGIVISVGEDAGTLSLWMVCEIGYINETYGVGILPMHNLQSGSLSFTAETENSYPVFSE